MTVIESVRPTDVKELARLHRAAFPTFFLSSLGTPFLRQFYAGFAEDPRAVALLARDRSGAIVAAAVGTVEPRGYFGRLLRARLIGFGLASLVAVIRQPRAAVRLARAVTYRGEDAAPTEGALLSSICVVPATRGTGVGRQLLDEWEREVARRGVLVAFLSTDAEGNAPVNAFYRAAGWHVGATFRTREGRLMNRYSKSLRSS